MARVYTIIKETIIGIPNIYIPIKATLNPHDLDQNAFCADLPSFFGGRVENFENAENSVLTENKKIETLVSKLEQESQNNITLSPEFLASTSSALPSVIHRGNHSGEPFYFYVLKGTSLGGHFIQTSSSGISILQLDPHPIIGSLPAGRTSDWYEHQCILRIPNTLFADANTIPVGGQYERNLRGLIKLCSYAINAAGVQTPGELKKAADKGNSGSLSGTHTSLAFDKFLSSF